MGAQYVPDGTEGVGGASQGISPASLSATPQLQVGTGDVLQVLSQGLSKMFMSKRTANET